MENIDSWFQRCQKAVFLKCDVDGSRCMAERLCREGTQDLTTITIAVQLMDEQCPGVLEEKIRQLQEVPIGPSSPFYREGRDHQARIMSFVHDQWPQKPR